MMLASDQGQNLDKLSATSRKMLELREMVLAEWEARARATFKEAKQLRHPVFINTMPLFYDNIVEAVSPDYPRETGTSTNNLASEHGNERARLTNYNPESLILEYQIFRLTILDVLHREGVPLSADETQAIIASIDEAIREAVTSFSLMVSAMREQFIAALTHDMRSPLGVANMAAELIKLTSDAPKTKELAVRILENVTRVDSMVQQLLDTMIFQHGQPLKLELEQFDILELVNAVCRQLVAGNPSLDVQVDGPSVTGWWSRDAVKRAIENLVGNALKYGLPDRPIRLQINQTHGHMLLSVHNEGPPIPAEEQEAVFQIFRRADNAKAGKTHGWGIGLPFVRAVAESHGGSIVVDSSAENGTTFTLDLPVDARPFQTPHT